MSTIEVNGTGSTIASLEANLHVEPYLLLINPLFASLKGNPFKDSPLSKSEQSETSCSIDDGSCVFINIFVNNIVFFVYNIYSTVDTCI